MVHIQYLAIIVSAIIAVAFSALYYVLLNKQVVAERAKRAGEKDDVRTKLTPNKLLVEFVRTFVTGLVMAYAIALLNILYFNQAVLLAAWLWIGFPVVQLVGYVIHEKFSPRLAIIHAGDWLVKLMIFAIILTLWR